MFNLGKLKGRRGETAAARKMFEAAITANPDFVRGHYYLAKLIMDTGGDLAEAERITRQGVSRDPENRAGPLGYFLLADLLNPPRPKRGCPAGL